MARFHPIAPNVGGRPIGLLNHFGGGRCDGYKNVSFGRAFLTSLAVLLMSFLISCSFEGTSGSAEVTRFCSEFEELPLTEASQGPLFNVYENPGTIKVIHGSGTAKHDFIPYVQNFIKVEQSQEIPEYAKGNRLS